MKAKVTAKELMDRLNSDPRYVARKKSKDDEIALRAEQLARAEAPLVNALRDAGAQVSSVWDLVNSAVPYPKLIPVLMNHLRQPYPGKVREGIARALAVPESRPYWHELVSRYLAEEDTTTSGVKWGLHLAIAAASDATVVDELIGLACDRCHGRNRALFVDALSRIRAPRAKAALQELANDPDLAGDIQRVAKKRRQ